MWLPSFIFIRGTLQFLIRNVCVAHAIHNGCGKIYLQLSGRHPTSERSSGNTKIGINLERVSVLFDSKHIDKLKLRHGGCVLSFKAATKEHSFALGIETRWGTIMVCADDLVLYRELLLESIAYHWEVGFDVHNPPDAKLLKLLHEMLTDPETMLQLYVLADVGKSFVLGHLVSGARVCGAVDVERRLALRPKSPKGPSHSLPQRWIQSNSGCHADQVHQLLTQIDVEAHVAIVRTEQYFPRTYNAVGKEATGLASVTKEEATKMFRIAVESYATYIQSRTYAFWGWPRLIYGLANQDAHEQHRVAQLIEPLLRKALEAKAHSELLGSPSVYFDSNDNEARKAFQERYATAEAQTLEHFESQDILRLLERKDLQDALFYLVHVEPGGTRAAQARQLLFDAASRLTAGLMIASSACESVIKNPKRESEWHAYKSILSNCAEGLDRAGKVSADVSEERFEEARDAIREAGAEDGDELEEGGGSNSSGGDDENQRPSKHARVRVVYEDPWANEGEEIEVRMMDVGMTESEFNEL